jgi:hypothetical protein
MHDACPGRRLTNARQLLGFPSVKMLALAQTGTVTAARVPDGCAGKAESCAPRSRARSLEVDALVAIEIFLCRFDEAAKCLVFFASLRVRQLIKFGFSS